MRKLERLYHVAEASNLPSILKHGLLSTECLLQLTVMPADGQAVFLRRHRRTGLRLADGVTIRDQAPMPPSALAPALDDGLTPEDWYALLNGFVFLWPDRDRMERQRRACGHRPQVVMTFDADALLTDFGGSAFVSPFNVGNARRRPARRGGGTLVLYAKWLEAGWPNRKRTHPPAEVLFANAVPARAPYLLDIGKPQP
jgi:hypothetical protein